MHSSKLILIAVLYLFGAPIANAGDTVACTAGGGECTGTTKCITLGANLACVEPCTAADVTTQCGTGFTCASVTDADGATVDVCATAQNCLTDAACLAADATLPICNLYTLTCEAAPTTTTTTTAAAETTTTAEITTTAENITTAVTTTAASNQGSGTVPTAVCEDKVVGGPNDCASLAAYCTNELYLDLMKEKCPKTCNYCTSGNGSGSSGTSSCRNALSDCSNKGYLCKNSIYKDFMKKNCAATCGYC